MDWEEKEGTRVDKMASQVRQYKESLSSCLVSAVEKLSREFQPFREDMSYSPPVWNSSSAIRSKRASAQERGYRGYTPGDTLWFYLRDHGQDMRTPDGKPYRHEYVSCKAKASQRWILPGKMPLQLPVGSSPERVEG